ncbi:uncharacterized protein V1513DRAFT_445389 [Lipomyces chichibuensis]|uniref:uncharacterized protein n=1 Tax=Lipomyces chichibuensis TaxID=1546026 RepID=UPI003343BE4F
MPRSSRPQSTYFPYVSSGPGTAEYLPPLHTLNSSPNRDSSALSTSTAPPRLQTQRAHHIHSYSFSPSASASASTMTTATSIQSQSPSPKTRSPRSQSSASSLSVNSHTSSSTAMTSSSGSSSTVLASSPIHQHASSPSPLSKEEKLRRRASQPVLVRAQNPNTSPLKQSRPGSLRTGVYGGVVSPGGVHGRKELVPVQYPAAGMFTVHAVLGSIGYSMPQFYETAFDFVEVCDAYFHMPGHLSARAVLGRGN